MGRLGLAPGMGRAYVIVNNTFIHRYNFNSGHLAQLHGTSVWAHDPATAGRPVCAAGIGQPLQRSVRDNLRTAATQQARRQDSQSNERIGNRSVPQNNSRGGLFGGMGNGQAARINSDHGFSSLGPAAPAADMAVAAAEGDRRQP
jgi:hypothetical protein